MTDRLQALANWLETDPDNLVLLSPRPTDPIRKRALSGVYFRVLTPNEAGVEAFAKLEEELSKASDFIMELIDLNYARKLPKTPYGRGLILSDYDGQEFEYINPKTDELEYYIYRVAEGAWV